MAKTNFHFAKRQKELSKKKKKEQKRQRKHGKNIIKPQEDQNLTQDEPEGL